MTDKKLLDMLSDIAFKRVSAVGDDVTRLDEPFKTIAIVYSAQGVIDNGGLRYFFENDWPNNPPYSEFADAYERIGRVDAANALRSAAASFKLERPEFNRDERMAYMDSHFDEARYEVRGWDDSIFGGGEVWKALAAWARSHPELSSRARN